MLTAADFPPFFEAVYGFEPFPWQFRLAEQLVNTGRWPVGAISLPTAAGKTALIDIAVFALACGVKEAARRIFFVVDRRVVVDEATSRARHLARTLKLALRYPEQKIVGRVAEALVTLGDPDQKEPLIVASLRGGTLIDDSWCRSPLQAAVCCSTVDQVGSSILFRAYGSRSPHNWPVRAGLAGLDALIIVDEAHLSAPFLQTLGRLQSYRSRMALTPVSLPFHVVEMSATPRDSAPGFSETEADWRHPVLGPRWTATKKARLSEEGNLELALAAEARAMTTSGAKVVGVIANRVQSARSVFEALGNDASGDAILFTGRSRPFDRDRLWRQWKGRLAAGRAGCPDRSIYVVATQCIEVGADLDFDAIVTEAASLDALEQRFGRLNRLGRTPESNAAIILRKESKKKEDPIYGSSLLAAWEWLNQRAVQETQGRTKRPVVDLGVAAMRTAKLAFPPERTTAPRQQAPVLLPAHMDRLTETSPEATPSPDVSLFLHGPQAGPADVNIVWRADLDPEDTSRWVDRVAVCGPSSAEALPVPIWAVRRWLEDRDAAVISDVEGEREVDEERPRDRESRLVLLWRGPDESQVVKAGQILPGSTIIVPASYGGCDQWGWSPKSQEPVTDIGDEVNLLQRGRAVLRCMPPIAVDENEDDPVRAALNLIITQASSPRTDLLTRLLKGDRRIKSVTEPAGETNQIIALVGSRLWRAGDSDFVQETAQSSQTVEVPLEKHLTSVAQRARVYSERCGLEPALALTVTWAGRLHDLGKADPRFQAWIRGGTWIGSELLAKSGTNALDSAARERARVLSGYPRGARHELVSAALIQGSGWQLPEEVDGELLLHLVAAHHGRCRPFAPVVADVVPVDVSLLTAGREWRASSAHGLERLESGVTDRFWLLTRRYGWHGLAFLETLLRLADHRQSEAEQVSIGAIKEGAPS